MNIKNEDDISVCSLRDAAIGVSEKDLLEYQDDDNDNDFVVEVEEKFTKMSNKLIDIMSNSIG